MAGREAAKRVLQQVRPILSVDREEARKRALNLYKAWYRQIPYIGEWSPLCHHPSPYKQIFTLPVMDYDIPMTIEQCRDKLREEFVKNRTVTDIRVIDMLVIKGQMELKESVEIWKQKGHIMRYWKESQEPKPTDFLSKFIQGVN
ncbi:hypothetical protein KR009_000288 [Drosophila setifemur]|nr:hypothetical protein KR009_000288 [Drosophila setifemur]